MAGEAILDLSDLINLATGGNGGTPEQINIYKSGLQNGAALGGTPVAGRLHSMWRWDGCPAAASQTAPTTAAVPTNATDGALKQSTPGTGKKKRLLGMVMVGLAAGSVILYDRLGHHGGLSGTTTTAQTTNLPTAALTRYTSGVGVEAWAEIYGIVGTTGTTVKLSSYTDDAGNASQQSQLVTFGATNAREQDRILPITLATGDKGVRAVASVQVTATTGTAGNFGVTLAYPIAVLPLPVVGVGALFSSFLLPSGPIDLGTNSDACLATAWFANGTTAPQLFGSAYFIEK